MPNPSRVPIFAPFGSENICPLGAKERWELRALPFGCHASTLTVVAVMSAVLAILALGVVGVGLLWLVRRTRWRWKETEYERAERAERADEEEQGSSRWRGWIWGLVSLASLFPQSGRIESHTEAEEDVETRPLLE